jgi:hypothetical protein
MTYNTQKTYQTSLRAAGKELAKFHKENREEITSNQQLQSYTMDLCGQYPLHIGALKDAVSGNEFRRMTAATTESEVNIENRKLLTRMRQIYRDEIVEGVSTFLEGFNEERGFYSPAEPRRKCPKTHQETEQTQRNKPDKPSEQAAATEQVNAPIKDITGTTSTDRPSTFITAGELIATSAISFIVLIAWLSLRQATPTPENPACINQDNGSCLYQKGFSPFRKPKSTCVDQGDGSCIYR